MNRAFLKKIFVLLLPFCLMTSCAGLGTDIMEGWINPTPVDKRTLFPIKEAWHDVRTPTLSRACRQGALTRKNVRVKATWKEYAESDYSAVLPSPETVPDGKGKMYKLYLTWRTVAPSPPPPHPSNDDTWNYYGFSFTIYTTEEDTITQCRVTKQFIGTKPRYGYLFE